MNDMAIRVDGLGKKYRIGGKQEGYKTLRDTLSEVFIAPFRRAKRLISGQVYGAAERDETIWALKDVSLQIKQGEVVGIIGANGAGKTTLLKILCRITEPTEGYAEIHGRVGSLLEVGTGFHPELTGRENIYLNGSILGMKKTEIESKFDEIVAFAEVDRFIDTPAKHYSTGMYVRLAFAVAAHLEPEILLVDEVLAVGDAAFQKKCLGKMGDVAKEGRTVLFVSHGMSAVRNLCSRVIWIDKGAVKQEGTADQVIQAYLTEGISNQSEVFFEKNPQRSGQISSIATKTRDETPATIFDREKAICIEVVYEVRERLAYHRVGVVLRTIAGVTVFVSHNSDFSQSSTAIDPGRYLAKLTIPGSILNEGVYTVSCFLGEPGVRRLDTRDNAIHLEIAGDPNRLKEKRRGVLAYPFEWVQRELK